MSEYNLTHLKQLEAESIHIMREVAAEFDKPVMLYSVGKDSAVMLHLALKAFYPGKLPFPLMHIDTTWKFKEMIAFRDQQIEKLGLDIIVHTNQEGVDAGVGPFTHGSEKHTDIMKTQALKQALNKHKFDAAFGGARRDEEKSRAKERVFSFRDKNHVWDPKNQRPELWNIYNGKINKGESIRVFPLSNWTELDIWQYIYLNDIDIVPLYFAKPRPVVNIDGGSPVLTCPGTELSFDAFESTVAEGFQIVSYEWDMGNGDVVTTTIPEINYTYAEPGGYKIQLHVTDDTDCENNNLTDYVVMVATDPDFTGTSEDIQICLGQEIDLNGVVNGVIWDGSPTTNLGGLLFIPDDQST